MMKDRPHIILIRLLVRTFFEVLTMRDLVTTAVVEGAMFRRISGNVVEKWLQGPCLHS